MARRPIRITYLIGSLDVGGAERQLVRLANGLDPARFEPRIVTLMAGGPLERDVRPGIPIANLSRLRLSEGRRQGQVGRFMHGSRMLYRLYRGLRTERPDVLHAYLPSAYVMGALTGWTAGIPAIVAGRRGLTSYQVYSVWRGQALARLANRLIAVHLCNSEAVRDYVVAREGLPRDRTAVIVNGIDPPDGPVPGLEPSWEAPVRVAMIANLISYKGHTAALDAMRQVAVTHPECKLVLFGGGPERERLERQRRDLGLDASVVFAGQHPDAARYLPRFDFLVLASTEEGLPNAIMEAMACGVPPIATDVGGVPELVDHGVHGLIVPHSDPTRMAEAITWMIEHPEERRRMGEAAIGRMTRSFSTRRMVTITEQLYESLVGDRPAGGRR